MRRWAGMLLVGCVGCTGCLGAGETPPSPDGDAQAAARDGGIWKPTGEPGVEVLSRGVALPPIHLAEDPAGFGPNAGSGPYSDMRVRLAFGGHVRTRPCPLPSGNYCDGFAAVDDLGHEVAVDTYAYLGPKPRCRSAWVDGAIVLSLTGVWQQRRTGTTEQSVLALATCDGLNGEESGSGAPAPASDDIRTLQSAWAAGFRVTVTGVVVARWTSSSGAFGFTLQDPDGTARSGVRVFRGKSSTVASQAPEAGDRVRVTARTGSTRQLEL
jgi:hypothetical protein